MGAKCWVWMSMLQGVARTRIRDSTMRRREEGALGHTLRTMGS